MSTFSSINSSEVLIFVSQKKILFFLKANKIFYKHNNGLWTNPRKFSVLFCMYVQSLEYT